MRGDAMTTTTDRHAAGSTPFDQTASPADGASAADAGRVARAIGRLADRRVLVVSGILATGLGLVLFATAGRGSLAAVADACGAPAPDTRFTTSAPDLEAFLAACGEEGRAAYRDLQLVDLAYPAALGVFLASAIGLLLPQVRPGRPLPRGARLLPLLPVLAAAADYTENVCAWWLLAAWPQVATVPAHLLGIASATKEVASWASGLLVVGLLAAVAARRVRGGRTDETDETAETPATAETARSTPA